MHKILVHIPLGNEASELYKDHLIIDNIENTSSIQLFKVDEIYEFSLMETICEATIYEFKNMKPLKN